MCRKRVPPDIGHGPDWQEKRRTLWFDAFLHATSLENVRIPRPSGTEIPASRRPGPWAGRFAPQIRRGRPHRRFRDRRAPEQWESPQGWGRSRISGCPGGRGTRARRRWGRFGRPWCRRRRGLNGSRFGGSRFTGRRGVAGRCPGRPAAGSRRGRGRLSRHRRRRLGTTARRGVASIASSNGEDSIAAPLSEGSAATGVCHWKASSRR